MSRRVLKILILSLCSFLASCLGGVFYIDLGNRYAWLESRTIVRITEEKENALYCDWIIGPQVLNFSYDDKYIIAYQVYDGSEYYDISAKQDNGEKDSLYTQFKKLEEIKHCYWIINKETSQVTGPLRKCDFDRKCKELHVKAKMRHFHEKKFWEGMSMEEISTDSAKRRLMSSPVNSTTNSQ